jgi:hypothetical protein
MKRLFTAFAFGALFCLPTIASGQERTESTIPAEYESVVSTVQRVVSLLSDVTQRHAADPISDQILSISDRLTMSGPVTGGFRVDAASDADLIRILRDVQRELESISRSLERRGEDDLADRMNDVLVDLDKAIAEAGDDVRIRRSSKDKYEISSKKNKVRIKTTDDDWWDSDDEWTKEDEDSDRGRWKRDWKPRRVHVPHGSATFAGEFTQRWPYREYGLYRNIPAVRYNRVEGFFLGVQREPLEWDRNDRGRIYGQIGYGFGMEDWRYEIGAETRFGSRDRNNNFDVKIGGSYHLNTSTNDVWKSSWAENSAAAFFFEHDFFDYYQTEGWSGYVVSRITPYAQLSVGYRADQYSSMAKTASWSLFGNNDFRPNPGINEGDMRSMVFTLEGGKVKSFNDKPSGAAFRLEAEVGQGMGGDFDFSRYVGDVRSYTQLTKDTGLSLRLRGGFTEGTVPLQKAFTIGGVGSVRSYNQNVFLGTRMLLANAELALYEPEILDGILNDLAILGLFDAGWTNSGGNNSFSFDDVIPAAGFGIAFDDRAFRLEVAWPLKNMGTGMDPAIWLRIAPTF